MQCIRSEFESDSIKLIQAELPELVPEMEAFAKGRAGA